MAFNPYLIPGTDCLQNKLGITEKTLLAEAEQKITVAKLAILDATPLQGKLDYPYFKAIHRFLFQDIYDWAGKERIFQTSKGISRFEWPERIQPEAQALFDELKKESHLQNVERPQFIQRAAHYFGELNVIHPFPEGNGRAQRVLFDQIARQAGYEFDWSQTTKDQVIEAVVHAYAVDTSKIEAMFEQTLSRPEHQIVRSHSTPLGLNDQSELGAAELKFSSRAFAELVDEPLQGGFDQAHLQAIHRRLFEKVFSKVGEHGPAFAGEFRDYPHPDGLVESVKTRLDYVFDQLHCDSSLSSETAGSNPDLYATRLAHHAAGLWACHPFRDGNTGSTLVFTELLARSHGVELFRTDMNVRAFRTSIADYVRGDRQGFLDLMERMVRDGLGMKREQNVVDLMAPEQAQHTLTSQAQINLQAQQRLQRAELIRLEKIRDTAKHTLHEQRGVLAKTSVNQVENAEHDRLAKAFALANRDVKHFEARFHARAEYRKYEALKIARQQHPEAACVVSDMKTRSQATELSERWKGLEQKIQSLGARGEHEAVTGYRRELSNLLSRIDRNSPVKAALSEAMRDRLGNARQENERAIGQSLERGRERER